MHTSYSKPGLSANRKISGNDIAVSVKNDFQHSNGGTDVSTQNDHVDTIIFLPGHQRLCGDAKTPPNSRRQKPRYSEKCQICDYTRYDS